MSGLRGVLGVAIKGILESGCVFGQYTQKHNGQWIRDWAMPLGYKANPEVENIFWKVINSMEFSTLLVQQFNPH